VSTTVAGIDGIRYEVREDVAYLTLDAPPVNILSAAMMQALAAAVERTGEDRSLKAVAFTAAGRAFSAGADVGEHRPGQADGMIAAFSRLFQALGASELPLVMAVDGAALGAGFELVMMSDASWPAARDVRAARDPAGLLRTGSGVAAGAHRRRGHRSHVHGRNLFRAEMAVMGLCPRRSTGRPVGRAGVGATRTRRASPTIMRMNVGGRAGWPDSRSEEARREAERVFLEELMLTEDVREGIASFHEKRRPEWKNR
jgi:enoyl-CoA hydratase/carnithine racemase